MAHRRLELDALSTAAATRRGDCSADSIGLKILRYFNELVRLNESFANSFAYTPLVNRQTLRANVMTKSAVQLFLLSILAMVGVAYPSDPDRLPVTGTAVAKAADERESQSGWTVDLTLPRDTRLAIRAVLAYDLIAIMQRLPCPVPGPQQEQDPGEQPRIDRTETSNQPDDDPRQKRNTSDQLRADEQQKDPLAAQPYTRELPRRVSRIAGRWTINADFQKLIGSADKNPLNYPQSLRLSFAEPGAPVLNEETTALIEEMFVARMKHSIIAIGKWESEPDALLARERDSNCFVTTRDGGTYLWLGTPDKAFVGAEVNFVTLGPRKAMLILDGNLGPLPPTMRKAENVIAYIMEKQ